MKLKLKAKWDSLSDDEKCPYEKKSRDHLAKQQVMKECITDALRKSTGGNCNPKFALRLLWEHSLLPQLDALIGPGGLCEGATIVHQEDNAGNTLHRTVPHP